MQTPGSIYDLGNNQFVDMAGDLHEKVGFTPLGLDPSALISKNGGSQL